MAAAWCARAPSCGRFDSGDQNGEGNIFLRPTVCSNSAKTSYKTRLKSAWRGKNPGEEGDSDRHGDGDKDSDMEVVAARLKVKRACCHLAHNWPTSSNCHHSENDGSKICRSLHYISPSISNCGTICLWPPICTTAS
ncbi:uncharacterized protein LOC124368577 isoform X2 [Homalodisca vitripennis]|uniref:uncharacterized protein LOC124368577 isoform X2 n=1 Tax=Homalodisca vitripennis TaxID=197043 RepID=UPI001EEA2A37|nr:uncharacterized protein LOC124368577 isoform X2 [Homalodisca vitripennis]